MAESLGGSKQLRNRDAVLVDELIENGAVISIAELCGEIESKSGRLRETDSVEAANDVAR